MKIEQFFKYGDKRKVACFQQGVDMLITQRKQDFKNILKEKKIGKLRTVMTNGNYTFKLIGTFHYEGPEFYCDDCKENHRQIVVNVSEVWDMTGSIIQNMN